MNNKKLVIIFVLLVLVAAAISFGVYSATHNGDYIYDKNGAIIDGKSELINRLKSIEDANARKSQIDFAVQQNALTQQEANELY